MTRQEAKQIVMANKALFPLDYLRLNENDIENQAMLYAKALSDYPLNVVQDAFIACTKTAKHAILISDIYDKLQTSNTRIYRKINKR